MKLLLAVIGAVLSLPAEVIEGTVINSATGTPIAGAAVRIESAGQTAYQATTDAHGAFSIEDVRPGVYTPDFSKDDFLMSDLDAAIRRPFSLPVASGRIRLDARLTPFGKVLGRVLDTNGDPIAGAGLLLNGSRLGLTGASDEKGQFSFHAAPGRYILIAKAPKALPPPAGNSGDRLGWVDTYYPGVTDSRAAAEIVLAAGAELWGHDIRLKAAPMRRVRGTVLDRDRNPVAGVRIRAARTDETLLEDIQIVSADDGSFEFPFLYDGDWIISGQQEIQDVTYMASAAAHVGDRELDSLELRLSAPFTVSGTVSVTGASSFNQRVGVVLRPAMIAGSMQLRQGAADDDGTFRIDGVYPGSHKVIAHAAEGLPVFLQSLRMGGRDILGKYVTFDPGSPPVEIVFESKGGNVRGSLDGCGSAVIVLVPQENELHDPQFLRTAKCGDGGRFEISNLRPGDYYAFAVNRWEGPLEMLDRMTPALINEAVNVHINRGETAVIELGATIADR